MKGHLILEVFREIGCQGRFCLLARRCRSHTRARGALSHGLRDCRLYESTACNRSCAAARALTPPDRARMRRTRPPRRSIVHQHERIALYYSRWRHDPSHRRQTAQDAAGSIRAPTRHDGMAGTRSATDWPPRQHQATPRAARAGTARNRAPREYTRVCSRHARFPHNGAPSTCVVHHPHRSALHSVTLASPAVRNTLPSAYLRIQNRCM